MSTAQTQNATAPKRTGKTTVRHVRVPDVIWGPAADQATAEGRNMSELVRDLLRDYNAGKRMTDQA